MPNIVAIELCI